MTANEKISPKDFLKKRRPERFSDSVRVTKPVLDRGQLEYHLDTLTSRKQEADFEEFARALAQKEICPNLLPQTGPTGGGDSKVDSETYPVADALAMAWYVGEPRRASTERWAFAMSAKKAWRPKLKSDIAKIAETNRGYVKAFFVTSQYVSDKKRSSLEDSLSEEHGLEVRILDRNWILDRVFESSREKLAQEFLGIGILRDDSLQGPRDGLRKQVLDATEERIRGAVEAGELSRALVEEVIDTIDLARGLELPEVDIRGRMQRAIRFADEYGTPDQRIRARYEAAWTAFWWLEDATAVNALYPELEDRVRKTTNARELELLTNLWTLLLSAVGRGNLRPEDCLLEERWSALVVEVDRLASDEARASAAWWATSLSLQLRLARAVRDEDEASKEEIVADYRTLVDDANRLLGVPLRSLIDLLIETSHVLEETPGADGLFERLEEVAAERQGEVVAAQLQMRRGARQLDGGRPIRAIASIGRALSRLAKHESREDLVRALYLIGAAYQRAGLLWAARGSLVTAASIAMAEFWTYGDINNAQLACYDRIRLIELELGRIPQALAWHQVCATWSEDLGQRDELPERMSEHHAHFDACLGIRFLKLNTGDLSKITQLPDTLDALALFNGAVALRWALGEEHLPEEFLEVCEGDPRAYFERWVAQPAAKHLGGSIELGDSSASAMRTRVLGCEISVTTENAPPCRELAESFLAALEAVLATGMLHEMISREPFLTVHVQKSETASAPLSSVLVENRGRPSLKISTPGFSSTGMSHRDQGIVSECLFEAIASVMGRVIATDELEERLHSVFGDEEALSRALSFTTSMVTLNSVLGEDPKFSLNDWLIEDGKRYRLARKEPWSDGKSKGSSNGGGRSFSPGRGPIPPELSDYSGLSHEHIRTVSLIREQLWARAGWNGTAFLYAIGGDGPPPMMALLFREPEAAREIFEGLREDLEVQDGQVALRVSVVRGVSASNPAHYRVVIGAEPRAHSDRLGGGEREQQVLLMLSRHCRMEPEDTVNLDGFLAAYGRAGRFVLAPAVVLPGESEPSFGAELGIELQSLVVREAWEVGRHDPEIGAIAADDDPIIPTDMDRDPPILEALRFKKRGV